MLVQMAKMYLNKHKVYTDMGKVYSVMYNKLAPHT